MSKRRLVITAVLTGQSQSEVARSYGVSQGWISRLMARYRLEGQAAFEPISRAPASSPGATPPQTVELVLGLRKQLADAGLDAGADTIGWHLAHQHATTLSRATINRILTRAPARSPRTRPSARRVPICGSKPLSRTRPGWTTAPATPSRSPLTSGSTARSSWLLSAQPLPPMGSRRPH